MLIKLFSKIKQLKEKYSNQADCEEIDLIQLWNLTPRDYEEAISLIPRLQNYEKDDILDLIDFL